MNDVDVYELFPWITPDTDHLTNLSCTAIFRSVQVPRPVIDRVRETSASPGDMLHIQGHFDGFGEWAQAFVGREQTSPPSPMTHGGALDVVAVEVPRLFDGRSVPDWGCAEKVSGERAYECPVRLLTRGGLSEASSMTIQVP